MTFHCFLKPSFQPIGPWISWYMALKVLEKALNFTLPEPCCTTRWWKSACTSWCLVLENKTTSFKINPYFPSHCVAMFLVTRWTKWRPFRSCFVSGQNCYDISVNKSLNMLRSLHNTSILTRYLLPDISHKNRKYGKIVDKIFGHSFFPFTLQNRIKLHTIYALQYLTFLYCTVQYNVVSELVNWHKSKTTDGNFKLKFNFSFAV